MIYEATFRPEFQRLMAWFNKTETQISVVQWFDKLKNIPDEAFPDIVDLICNTSRQNQWPTPQDVQDKYFSWLDSHPSRKAEPVRTWCQDCNGTGILRVSFEANGGLEYTAACRCRGCLNWEGRVGTWCPTFYRSELERNPRYTVITRREQEDGEDYIDPPISVTQAQIVTKARRMLPPAMSKLHIVKALPNIKQEIDF